MIEQTLLLIIIRNARIIYICILKTRAQKYVSLYLEISSHKWDFIV